MVANNQLGIEIKDSMKEVKFTYII